MNRPQFVPSVSTSSTSLIVIPPNSSSSSLNSSNHSLISINNPLIQTNLNSSSSSLSNFTPIQSFYWFKYSSNDIYKLMNLDSLNPYWVKQQTSNIIIQQINNHNSNNINNNTSNFINSMCRVCPIEEATYLLTGGLKSHDAADVSSETFLFQNGNFIQRTNMLNARKAHGTIKAANFVYVCGGVNKNYDTMTECEAFNLQNNKWTAIANLNKCKYMSIIIYSEITFNSLQYK